MGSCLGKKLADNWCIEVDRIYSFNILIYRGERKNWD